MRVFSFFLLLGALLLVAQPAAAQTYCFVDNFGYGYTLTPDNPTDIILGSVPSSDNSFTWAVVGGRGRSNQTVRHHSLTMINPRLTNDPGCADGAGFNDWYTYNGKLTGNAAPFGFSGDWVTSCGGRGTFSGTVSLGACPAPRSPGDARPDSPMRAGTAEPDEIGAAATAEAFSLAAHPNPASDEARIRYMLGEPADVRLVVYDALGRQVATLAEGQQEAGSHEATFDARGLAAGAYVYHLTAGSKAASGRLTLSH